MPKAKKRTPLKRAALTKQEKEMSQSLAGGMTPYQDPLMLSGMPDPVGPPEDWRRVLARAKALADAGDYEGSYALLAEQSRRRSPEERSALDPISPRAYPKWGKRHGTRKENLERVKRDYLERVMALQGDFRPGKDHRPWKGINYPLSDMKPRPDLWTEDPMKGLEAMLRRQRKHQAPRQQQPRPSDAEFLKMWEERNRMLQEQMRRTAERRKFEEERPMLPSGASDIRRFPAEGDY